jgi:hypothetical protein
VRHTLSAATPAWLDGTPGPYRSTPDDDGGAASGDGEAYSGGGAASGDGEAYSGGGPASGGAAYGGGWRGLMIVAG